MSIPAYPPEYDQDEFAECRALLEAYGYSHLDPEDLECDPKKDTSTCPIKDKCRSFYAEKIRKDDPTAKARIATAQVRIAGFMADWSLSPGLLLTEMKGQAADRESSSALLKLWREYGRLCAQYGSENVDLYITGDVTIDIRIDKGDCCEVCGALLKNGICPVKVEESQAQRHSDAWHLR